MATVPNNSHFMRRNREKRSVLGESSNRNVSLEATLAYYDAAQPDFWPSMPGDIRATSPDPGPWPIWEDKRREDMRAEQVNWPDEDYGRPSIPERIELTLTTGDDHNVPSWGYIFKSGRRWRVPTGPGYPEAGVHSADHLSAPVLVQARTLSMFQPNALDPTITDIVDPPPPYRQVILGGRKFDVHPSRWEFVLRNNDYYPVLVPSTLSSAGSCKADSASPQVEAHSALSSLRLASDVQQPPFLTPEQRALGPHWGVVSRDDEFAAIEDPVYPWNGMPPWAPQAEIIGALGSNNYSPSLSSSGWSSGSQDLYGSNRCIGEDVDLSAVFPAPGSILVTNRPRSIVGRAAARARRMEADLASDADIELDYDSSTNPDSLSEGGGVRYHERPFSELIDESLFRAEPRVSANTGTRSSKRPQLQLVIPADLDDANPDSSPETTPRTNPESWYFRSLPGPHTTGCGLSPLEDEFDTGPDSFFDTMKERNRELALVGLGGTIGVELVDMCGCSKCDRRRAYEAARELKNKAAAAGDAKETSEQRARAMAELDEEDGGVSLLAKTVDVESYGAATPGSDVNGNLDAGSYLEHYANAMALLEGEENASDVDEGVGIDCSERFAGQHVQDAIATPEAGVAATHDEGIAIEHASVGCQVDLDEDFGLYEYLCRAILEEEPHVKAESEG